MQAFSDLGLDITSIDLRPIEVLKREKKLFWRIYRKLLGPPDLAKVREQIKNVVKKQRFDLIWLDKTLTISPSVFQKIRKYQPTCVIAGYSPDDMMNRNNRSPAFLKTLPYYDIYFTTKSYGVKELKHLGCPYVKFVPNAFDPYTHHPISVDENTRKQLGGQVGFIGQWEPDRAESLYRIAESGFSVRVWGYTWERCKFKSPNLLLENKPLWGEQYAKAICSFDINLCFLRKANRDLQTTRSIEIPACGGFMLGERTSEHLKLFQEGKEAEFFNNDKELIDKVCYYLAHDEERKQIADAGRKRCITNGYSNHERLKKALSMIENLYDEKCRKNI